MAKKNKPGYQKRQERQKQNRAQREAANKAWAATLDENAIKELRVKASDLIREKPRSLDEIAKHLGAPSPEALFLLIPKAQDNGS